MKTSFHTIRFFLLPTAFLTTCAGTTQSQPVRVSDSRHYLQFGGKPILLIGDSVTQGWMECGTDFDQHAYLDALAAREIDAVLLWSYIGTSAKTQLADKRIGYDSPELWPWRGSPDDCSFDLTQFNPAYFQRLHQLIKYAESRNIIVIVTVQDGWTKTRFAQHPFNVALGNGPLTDKRQFVELADYDKEMPDIYDARWTRRQKNQYFQERFAEKLCSELADCPNLIFEMFNEGEWYNKEQRRRHEEHFLRFFRRRATALLMTNTDHIRDRNYAPRENPVVDILSFHKQPWTGHYATFVKEFRAKPSRVIFESEPVPSFGDPQPAIGGKVSLDELRAAVWERTLSGCGWVAQNDTSFGWDPKCAIAGQAKLRDEAYDLIGYAARFFNKSGVRFWAMAPHGELTSTGLCLAQPGYEYVVYAPKGGVFTVDLAAAKGKTLEVRWYNPRGGQFRLAEKIDGGDSRQFTPPFQDDAVLHIKSVAQIDARDPNEITNVPLWGLFETRLVNNHKYSNPFRDVTLSAVFRSPSGKSIDFFGYYDGDGKGGQTGNVWKLRFMPDEIGTWSYVCRFSDDSPGKRGEFACVAQGAKPGPFRAEGRWLKFAGGKWFYPRSYYFSEAFSGVSPYWEKTIDMFFGGKYNYNFCCTTFWQGRLLRKNRWNNIEYNGFYPIYGKDYTRLDLRSWRHVDKVLQRLESHGVVWFNFDGFVPNVGGEMGPQRTDFEAQKIYIRNVVARLAPYWNVTWNIAFEWREFMSADQVRRLVDFTKKIDPWAHLVTVHDQGRYKEGKELLAGLHVDLITLQYDAGKCGQAITANRLIQRYAGNVPVYAQEVCWEADTKLNPEQVRKGAWGVVLAGGLLNYAEMFEGPSQGRPENYGDGKAIPYLEILFDFMQSLPYRQMAPHNELLGEGCICFAEPGLHYVCYAPNGETIQLDLTEAPGRFSGQWLNPRDGRKKPTATINGGSRQSFCCPDKNDWILYLNHIE